MSGNVPTSCKYNRNIVFRPHGLTAKQVIKILKKNGWKLVRTKGSHHHFLKEGAIRPVTVPVHGNKDWGAKN